MNHAHHESHQGHAGHAGHAAPAHHAGHAPASHAATSHAGHGAISLNRIAFLATLHCLTGCAIGEVAGMAIGTALGWSNAATIALAIGLAFAVGYALAMIPLRRGGFGWSGALKIAFAAETLSIATMEIVDNGFMLVVPGAMDAGLGSLLFWGSLTASLIVAAAAAFPLNRWLISRGWGHALAHADH